jgi:hypothetical protein
MLRQLFFSTLLLSAIETLAQQPGVPRSMYLDNGCSFADAPTPQMITYYDASQEANLVVKKIMEAAGIQQKLFTLLQGNVPNARAAQKFNIRYVIYNQQFMESFKSGARTYWAAYFLMAHEIGHHVLNHNFAETAKEKRHEFEFQADTFATRIMVNMGATYDETILGIQTFDKDAASNTHPEPSQREKRIADAYRFWKSKYRPPVKEPVSVQPGSNTTPTTGTLPGANKVLVDLDQEAFKHRFNLINNAVAEIDDEKITIKFDLPPFYLNKRIKICLLSNDENILPGARTPGSLKGTGVLEANSNNMTLIWNYRMDGFIDTRQVSAPGMLRLFVFDINNLPGKVNSFKDFISKPLIVLGAGSTVWGIVEMSGGKYIYDNDYKKTFIDTDLDRANEKWVRGQVLVVAGLSAAIVGYCFLRKINKQKAVDRTIICQSEPKPIRFEPIISVPNNSMAALGIRLRFE